MYVNVYVNVYVNIYDHWQYKCICQCTNASNTDSDCLVPSLHPALCIQLCREDAFAIAFYNSVEYFKFAC